MAKRPRGSTSQGEPSPKKVRRGSEAETLTQSTQMPEVVPLGDKKQEEEEEEEAVPTLRSRGLRSRGLCDPSGGRACGRIHHG